MDNVKRVYEYGGEYVTGDGTGQQKSGLGPEIEDECEAALQERIAQALPYGLSSRNCKRLEALHRKYRTHILLRVNASPPAQVTRLRIHHKPNACSVQAYPRHPRTKSPAFCDKIQKR